ncbi:pleckstrin homology domain-containing family G member 3 [Malaclemys terrapin pileata]|uniref:pleckstrin homology domain-containing family G member 3 n=1 Tax=Malaclemys terrapin pileata TaxID=2991368 RepID=UPI0023A81496|nr:pleckstrin homology domain-containing family G member 3 [Malaclemys terrapin pileata]
MQPRCAVPGTVALLVLGFPFQSRTQCQESPRLPALPCPGSYDRMPVCAAAGAHLPECPVSRMPMEGQDKAPSHAPAWEGDALRVNQLHNSNNNASPGGWLGRKGSRSLSPFGPRAPAGANHTLSYLERVVLELVESERTYVRDLRSIVEDYLGKIIDTEEELLRPEQVSALFGNIEDIYELNSELLQDLDSCDSNPVAVARCFVDRSQDFDIYTQYCNNYPNSVAALTECMRNKHQAKFFRERQEQIGHVLPLGSYLLKPVQRILKYHLLLQEIAKHFDLEEAGYEVVEEAIDTMTCVAWYINDMKRRHEHAVRLQEIQSLLLHWKGPDLTTFGELVLEGTFRVHRVRNERTFFLFDRTLLITKRRGDHFVCKNDIPCSSLMLIESTRDSLCFSVTHYKHSKQQYSIQAKSVEEKRVWTHHIKRLILENHHAIIPQKAKEAILEMDSSHPARYRYSPERLKKAKSCQPMDEVPPQARQGRRQSEPFHLRRRREKLPDGLHGGVGSGRAGRRKSEPAKQIVKQLGEKAGLKHADSTGALLEAGAPLQVPGSAWQPAEGEGGAEEEEAAVGKEEEQALGQGSLEELAVSDSSEKGAGPEEEGPVGEEQVADFASFLLAALHGWHCRANALLFSRGRTGKGPKGSQEPGSPENRRSAEMASAILEAAPEPSELPEEEGPEESPEAASTPKPAQPAQQRAMEQEQSLATAENMEDLKALSSEEEEEEEEETRARSILPPSVLDHASLIAEMFASSFSRRSSLALEEGRPGGFLTPRLVSRSSSVLSLEGSEKGQGRGSAANSQGRVSPPGSTRSEAASPGSLEPERTPCHRKESMLSQRDRLLLDKIKSYYECAEHRDAGFSIRRRESLSYIPKGLVRNSVCRLNSLPPPEQHADARRGAGGAGSGGRTAAWVLAGVPTAGSRAEPSTPVAEEEFRPPAEMIKVWEGMEKLSAGQPCPERGSGEGTAGATAAWPLDRSQENGLDLHEPLLILEDDELSAIAEESAGPSPESRSPTERAGPTRLAGQLQRLAQELGHPAKPCPRVPPLSEAELSERLKNKVYQLARQYSLRIRNRQPAGHRRLAKLEELRSCAASPPRDGHQEVKRSPGPRKKPALSLAAFEQVVLQEYSPRTPVSATASSQDKSPKCFSYSPSCPTSPGSGTSPGPSSCSPLSPIVAETFTWPDVRELRSRYSFGTAFPGPRRPPPVNRSRSAPEKMVAELPGGVPGQEGWRGLEQSTGRDRSTEESPDPSARQRQRNQSAGSLRITAEAMLGDQRVIVLEKVPCGGDPPAPEEPPDAASYVQIRSPTSRERISLKAVAERCKAYQESDEYRRLEEGPAPEPSRAAGWEQAAAGQHGRVRSLREKFQTLNSAS